MIQDTGQGDKNKNVQASHDYRLRNVPIVIVISDRIGLSLVFGKQTANNGPTNWPFSHFCLANEHRPLTTIA
ncbi:hypothetical protein ACLKA7_004589 [Drosophila subpalustris]